MMLMLRDPFTVLQNATQEALAVIDFAGDLSTSNLDTTGQNVYNAITAFTEYLTPALSPN